MGTPLPMTGRAALALILILICGGGVDAVGGRCHLLINALDAPGLREGLAFLASPLTLQANCTATVYVHEASERELSKDEQSVATWATRAYYKSVPLPDRSRSRRVKQVEYVSNILEALTLVSTMLSATSPRSKLLSLVFKGQTLKMKPSFGFGALLETTLSEFDVALLPKNRGLTSVSDYHDVLVLGLQLTSATLAWLETFSHVYRHHANRQAFSVLEPRPALLEASVRHRSSIKLGFFSPEEIVRLAEGGVEEGRFGGNSGSSNSSAAAAAIQVTCREAHGEGNRCMLSEPTLWLRRVDRHGIPKDFYSRVAGNHLKAAELDEHLPHGMWDGSLRFFQAENETTPRKFCWERNTTSAQEKKARARVVFNSTFSEAFEHTTAFQNKNSSAKLLTAVLLTGMEASAQRLDNKLYLNVAKMVYCFRHGYKFLQLSSNQFRPYFEPHTFEGIGGQANGAEYFQGFMAKVPMVVTAMMQHPEHEWVVWTDDDVYINPGWLYLPLDAFLAQVPSDKTFVSANYRSAFTNIFAIRNNDAGRRLAIDWLAVAQSGFVECHGYDQAAIQTLILLRIAGNMNNPFPFNHSCLFSPEGESAGCNNKGRWSCDFQFEKSLYFAGFKTAINNNFFELRLSSYSKGCANDAVPDFHVVAETSNTPRLQAGHATRLYEVFSSGHWDGPLGGGNDKLRRGAVNGWFTSHKAEFLFWESYLDPLGCQGVPVVEAIPPCEYGSSSSTLSQRSRPHHAPNFQRGRGSHLHSKPHVSALIRAEHDSTAHNNQQHAAYDLTVVSLVDGYGFDLLRGEYCRVLDPEVLRHQREFTYMRDYATLIRAGGTYSQTKWDLAYRNFSGGEGRAPCHGMVGPGTGCDHGEGTDGQKQREAMRPDNEHEYFERAGYCETCLRLDRPSDRIRVVDCRLDADVLSERERNVSFVQDPDDMRKNLWS